MSTVETIETTQHTEQPHRQRTFVVVAAVIAVAVVAAVGIWALTQGNAPVAAEDARIELTFTGDDASYDGDREIVAGSGEVVFVNDASVAAWLVVQYFEPGSPAAEADLASYPEGSDFVTTGGPSGDPVIMQSYAPGRTIEGIDLRPGTYFVEAALAGPDTTHVWRPAVIEVVAE